MLMQDERNTPEDQSRKPTTNSQVSLEDLRHVAELANVELAPDEEQRLTRDLNAILEYTAQLGELDTSGIAPMSQVAALLPAGAADDARSALRADQPRPSLPRDVVMGQAPETDGAFFKVPKVIER